MGSASVGSIPTVDLSPFTSEGDETSRKRAAKDLVQACHDLGFVNITGHGVRADLLEEAFAWMKKLFDLPMDDKMKAPHPKESTPHRGYSAPGVEKVYSKADLEEQGKGVDQIRKIQDFKESYEIGSEDYKEQGNIWLPEVVLPGFRSFMLQFYFKCDEAAQAILQAFILGLDPSADDAKSLLELNAHHQNQLRLLHYPEVATEKLQKEVLARMPAHTDWGTFTMLFQDTCGGLELQDPHTKDFVPATPSEGTLTLNTGDMLQRATNDYFISAKHRVSLPPPTNSGGSSKTPERYSIPYFIAPAEDTLVRTLQSFVAEARPAKYEPVVFKDYGAMVSQYQYAGGKEEA